MQGWLFERHYKRHYKQKRPVAKNATGLYLFGSPGRARTADLVINSYQHPVAHTLHNNYVLTNKPLF